MKFHKDVPKLDRERIIKALKDIKKYGNSQQVETVRFMESTEIEFFIGPAEAVGGSGSVCVQNPKAAKSAISKGDVSIESAAKFIRLNIARETIDTGGQQGIEGTLVHEGKHARDFALMISTFSTGDKDKFFDPPAFQREYSAHLTAAFYLMKRGGSYAQEGIDLGLLFEKDGKISVSKKGIRSRLKNSYGLTEGDQRWKLSEISNGIKPRRKKFLGIF